MLYLTVSLYLAYLSYRYDFGRGVASNFRAVHRVIALLILVLISGLRYRLAPDTVAYMAHFETDVVTIEKISFDYLANARYQPFWVLLNSVCKTFGDFTLLQFAVAWIFNGSVFYFFRKSTKKYFSAILIYYLTSYFYFSMEILRESLAIAMFIIAVVKFNDRRLVAGYGWLVAAALFHKFAILIVFVTPFLLTSRIPALIKGIFTISAISLLAGISNPLAYISSFGGFLNTLNLHMYDVDSKLSAWGLAYNLLRIVPISIVLLWYWHRPLKNLRLRKEIVFPLCWAFVAVIVIRIVSIPFMDRISNYFILFTICSLVSAMAEQVGKVQNKITRMILVGTCCTLSFIFYILPLLAPDPKLGNVPTYRRYYPYSSIFTKEKNSEREYLIYLEAKE